jgi:hypothetical protein
MADQPQLQQSQPAPILPVPLPTQVSVNLVQASGPGQPTTHLLLWEVTTPAGTAKFFTDKRFAQQILQIVMGHLQRWPAELVVPQVDLAAVQRSLGQPNGRPRKPEE